MKDEVRWGLILKLNSFRHFWRIITIYSAGHFRETQFSITASLPEHLQRLQLKDVIFQLFLLSLVIYFLCLIASYKAEKNSFWEKHGIELQKYNVSGVLNLIFFFLIIPQFISVLLILRDTLSFISDIYSRIQCIQDSDLKTL